jgi:hypothetical protein
MTIRPNVLVMTVLAFLVVSCGTAIPGPTPTLSPQQEYSNAMAPLLPRLKAWMQADSELTALMASPVEVGAQDFAMTTTPEEALYFIEGTGSMWTASELAELYGPVTEKLSPSISTITEEGFSLQTQLEALAPPPEFTTYHNEILNCIKSEMNRARGIAELLTAGSTLRELDPQACDNWAPSLSGIGAFASQPAGQ